MKLKRKDYFFVGMQFLLFFVYLFDFKIISINSPVLLRMISGGVTITGIIVLSLALLQLNKNLSPFPTPKSTSKLTQTGLYHFVRHPIYTGILLTTFGYALYTDSSFKLLISIVLLILFYFKSSYEESMLLKRYSDYSTYKKKVGRFLPKL